jgi:hypothetical protein
MSKMVMLVLAVVLAWAISLTPLAGGADATTQRVTLQPKFLPGEYTQTITTETKGHFTVSGKTSGGCTSNMVVISYTIQKPDAQGNTIATIQYKRAKITSDSDGKAPSTSYDSDAPPDDPILSLGGGVPGLMAAAKFKLEVIIGNDNKVTGVKGLGEFWEKVAASSPKLVRFVNLMKESFNDETVKTMVEKLWEDLPAKPVAIGDAWTVLGKIDFGFLIAARDIQQKFVLKELKKTEEGEQAMIGLDAKIEAKENETTTVKSVQATFKKLEVVRSGLMKVNAENPMLQNMTVTEKGAMELAAPEPNGDIDTISSDWDSRTEQKITLAK